MLREKSRSEPNNKKIFTVMYKNLNKKKRKKKACELLQKMKSTVR